MKLCGAIKSPLAIVVLNFWKTGEEYGEIIWALGVRDFKANEKPKVFIVYHPASFTQILQEVMVYTEETSTSLPITRLSPIRAT